MLYVFLDLAIYFYRFIMWCLALCSSFTLFSDAVFLSLCSYLFLPFCHVMCMVLLCFYSFLVSFMSFFFELFSLTVLLYDIYFFARLLLMSFTRYVFRWLVTYFYPVFVMFICLLFFF